MELATTYGRPTKLTPDLQAVIVESIRQGNYVETAAATAGITKAALYDWLKRGGREKSGIYHAFNNAVQMAQAEAEERDVAIITRAAQEGVWQAAAWRLERKNAQKWGRKDHLTAEIESTHTQRLEMAFEHHLLADPMSAELLKQLHRRQLSLEGADGGELDA